MDYLNLNYLEKTDLDGLMNNENNYKKITNDLYNVELEIILLNKIDNKNFEKLYTILNIFEDDLKKIEKNNILLNGFIDRHSKYFFLNSVFEFPQLAAL